MWDSFKSLNDQTFDISNNIFPLNLENSSVVYSSNSLGYPFNFEESENHLLGK